MADPTTTQIATQAVQAIPWGPIILGAVGIVSVLVTGFFGMVKALRSGWDRERALLKGIAKRSVVDTKLAFDELERLEQGYPSSIPPVDDADFDDSSAVIDAIKLENDRRAAERRRRLKADPPSIPPLDAFHDARTPQERRQNETDRDLRRFTSKGTTTPPGGFEPPTPPDPPFRRKLPSRRG